MTQLTPEQLANIVARDERTTIYDQGTVHERVTIGGGGSVAAVDRRALLSHISALESELMTANGELINLRKALDTGLKEAIDGSIAARDARVAELESELATVRNDLQASQCAEAMASDDVRALRAEVGRLAALLQSVRDFVPHEAGDEVCRRCRIDRLIEDSAMQEPIHD